jgi:hypothetical protein
VDGENWTEIDRKTNNRDFEEWNLASFTVSKPAECRFIRLTQTAKNRNGEHKLSLSNIEFFGILYESKNAVSSGPIPVEKPISMHGIISYLTEKYGGNVHEKGIVTITSKSARPDVEGLGFGALRHIADFNDDEAFISMPGPGQWVCWDFHESRVSPIRYEIRAHDLDSWVVETSLDGKRWTEIDRQTNTQGSKKWKTTCVEISDPEECRFIRLTDKDTIRREGLRLCAVEFGGLLYDRNGAGLVVRLIA